MNSDKLLHAVPIPLIRIGPDERIGALNPTAAGLFGDAAAGRHYITVLRQPALLDRIETALTTGTGGSTRYLTSEAGLDVVYAVTVAALEPEAGVLVAFQDETRVEDALKMRSDFVANVSHELRTPLTALAGFIETLRGGARDDAAARDRFLEIMAHEAGRMNRLVQDLLSLSRVEDMERQRPTEQVDVAAIVRSALAGLAPLAQSRAVSLMANGCDRPALAPGDADQLTQVFTNLVENAIKYGAEGGEVRVRLTALDNAPLLRGPGLSVEVADQGAGIDQRHLARLTERFYRVDDHRSRDMGGTGLGLAIVKHIVNRHRGRMRVDSTPGQGSRFTVLLPLYGA